MNLLRQNLLEGVTRLVAATVGGGRGQGNGMVMTMSLVRGRCVSGRRDRLQLRVGRAVVTVVRTANYRQQAIPRRGGSTQTQCASELFFRQRLADLAVVQFLLLYLLVSRASNAIHGPEGRFKLIA